MQQRRCVPTLFDAGQGDVTLIIAYAAVVHLHGGARCYRALAAMDALHTRAALYESVRIPRQGRAAAARHRGWGWAHLKISS
jgi:hypothetical protein